MAQERLIVAGASRPKPGETANGDAWTVDWYAGSCRVAVIDGLGHGPEAARAADVALAVLASGPSLAPVEALRACHAALWSTRGAVISIARIDLHAELLSFAGVGNVEGRLWHGIERHELVAFRGILGARLPVSLRVFEYPLTESWLLVLNSDGVSWRSFGLKRPAVSEKQGFVEQLLQQGAKDQDDATVVAAWAA